MFGREWSGVLILVGMGVPTACSSFNSAEADTPGPGGIRGDALITTYAAAAITLPPDSLDLDSFYRKYVSAGGIPVIASGRVPDAALLVARDIVDHMLLNRPDIRSDMVDHGQRVGVMAVDEMTTDLPEQRDWRKPALDDPRLTDREREQYNEPGGIASMTDQEYWNRRARGMGGRYTTCAEENLLGYPGTRYFGEHILVHEFSHGIHGAIRRVDPELAEEIQSAYEDAMAAGRFKGHYAATSETDITVRCWSSMSFRHRA